METETLLPIASQLEKMSSGEMEMDTAAELIGELEKAEISVDALSKTRIGLILNAFRKKTTDDKLAKRVKQLIKNWKTKCESEAKAAPVTIESRKKSSTTAAPPGDHSEAKRHKPAEPKLEASTSLNKVLRLQLPADATRQRNVTILSKSLTCGELPDGSLDPENIALQIEASIYELHGEGEKYTSTIRSRVFNLRDKNNPDLRANVITGSVSPSKFAKMTANEMASSDMKKLRKAFTEEAINEHQMSVQEGTPTDMFKCGKCTRYNCTYSQVQTRSADEPMTTFVFCRDCGNRWKFC